MLTNLPYMNFVASLQTTKMFAIEVQPKCPKWHVLYIYGLYPHNSCLAINVGPKWKNMHLKGPIYLFGGGGGKGKEGKGRRTNLWILVYPMHCISFHHVLPMVVYYVLNVFSLNSLWLCIKLSLCSPSCGFLNCSKSITTIVVFFHFILGLWLCTCALCNYRLLIVYNYSMCTTSVVFVAFVGVKLSINVAQHNMCALCRFWKSSTSC